MKRILFILVIGANLCYGGNSKILGAIGDFLPNFTEIGFITNIINVYFQVSQFVRATNEIVGTMKAVKCDIEVARKEMLQI